MDTGSQRTYISEHLAKKLQLRPDHYEVLDISVFGDEKHSRKILPRTRLDVITGNQRIQIRPLIVSSISENLPNYDRDKLFERYPYLRDLKLAPQCLGRNYRLDVLIGSDAYWHIVQDGVIRGSETGPGPQPVAIESKIGYMISGPTSLRPNPNDSLSDKQLRLETVLSAIAENAPSIPDYFEVEKLGVLPDVEEQASSFNMERYVSEEIVQDSDKHYTASLPINDRINELPSCYNVCQKVTREMVRKMPVDKRLLYHKIILDQLDRGFIEYTMERNRSDGHYLMHYAVQKATSSSTPIRIVYRCNFRLGDNPSLNDCLNPGVPMLQDLGGILMRVRLFDTVLSADIEKAFLQVRLRADHRKYTKFLWLTDPYDIESPFVEIQFRSVLFGASPSPFILNAVLHKHLQINDCPISRSISRNIYVDNLICSTPSNSLANELYTTANRTLTEGGFHLRAWTSNDPSIQIQAERENIALRDKQINILGMVWNKDKDTLACKALQPLNDQGPVHPKSVLSETARLFDVTGFLLPVHVRAKRLLQDLQRHKMKSKAKLPPEKLQLWKDIHHNLVLATSEISWPRQAIKGLLPETPTELHIFADSSKASLGTVAYIVANRQSAILWAKNTLVPVKDPQPSIPRCELNACVMAANLLSYVMDHVGNCINIVKTTLWSDSQIVLHWLHSKKKLEIYVQRRVTKIKNANFSEIRYCPTGDMPADLLTRGITTAQLRSSQLWWQGPRWLLTKRYPACDIQQDTTNTMVGMVGTRPPLLDPIIEEEETVDNATCSVTMDNVCTTVDCERFSKLTKLLRVTVLVHRFARKLILLIRGRGVNPVGLEASTNIIAATDLQSAKDAWIRRVQSIHYANEIREVKKQTRRKTALVRQLHLFMDEKCILRKGSRMKLALIPEETKYRIILPNKHHFTKLVIDRIHSACLHDGLQHTLSSLRSSYWISKDAALVKRILKDCIVCNLINSRHFVSPPTPDLPKWRLDSTKPPFSTVGVDYTGAVLIKDKHTGEKRKVYIVLYTCAVTRGVHLHYVEDQSTEQFLLSFVQFCARKSVPAHMYSDNASTFLAADDVLKRIMSDPIVRDHMTERNIVWQFIPKRAPWFGAIYERLIGIMKRTLAKVIGKSLLTQYELATVLTKIEANMNDRPLTRCIADNSDEDVITPLTPAHLIYGRRITPFPDLDIDPDDEPFVPKMTHEIANKTLQRMSQIHEHFWNRFSNEYLIALMDTHKLRSKADFRQNIKVGDIVLVHHELIKRPQWKMAIVHKLLPGPDGFVRAAEVRTSSGITNRPIVKLYPVELSLENYEGPQKEPDNNTTDELKPEVRIQRAAKIAARGKIKGIASYESET